MIRFCNLRRLAWMGAVLFVVSPFSGCGGGETNQTAPFPNVDKPPAQSTAKVAPSKGMDRVGSESGTPNP